MDTKSSNVRPRLDELIEKNVEAISKIEEDAKNSQTLGDRIAGAIAGFCGSMMFVYVHIGLFGGWLAWNSLLPKGMQFDPAPFNGLALAVSLEAIFLSTFILVRQNHQQRVADQRNHLDLQVNMLAEQESSQMLKMMRQIMDHFEIAYDSPEEIALEEATDALQLAEEIKGKIGE